MMRLTTKLMHTADAALRSIESMRQDPLWVPVIAGLKDHAWCKGSQKAAADLTQLLTGTGRIGNLSAAVAQRVQACLLPLVSYCPDLCIRLHLMHESCFLLHSPVLGAAPSSPAVKCLNPFSIVVVLYCCVQLCVCCVVSIALLLSGLVGVAPRCGWYLLKYLDCRVVCSKCKRESGHHNCACCALLNGSIKQLQA